MKNLKIILCIFLLSIMLSFGDSDNSFSDGGSSTTGITPIYVSFASHNEDDVRYDMYDTYDGYVGMREAILKIQDLLDRKGEEFGYDIPFDFQTDWRFLEAIRKWENEELMATTNNKNILRYLKEDLGVAVEPHTHECATMSESAKRNYPEYVNGCNYADIAYLIEDILGYPGDWVTGGYRVYPPDEMFWEDLQSPQSGFLYPDYSWQAEVLWGGGSARHCFDPKLSGVWAPQDHEHYLLHDPAQDLVVVAGGGASTERLLNAIESGKAPSGKIYTQTFMIFEEVVYRTGGFGFLESTLDRLDSYVKEGKVVYATIPEVKQIWKDKYNSEPNIYNFLPECSDNLDNDFDGLVDYPKEQTGFCQTDYPVDPGCDSETDDSEADITNIRETGGAIPQGFLLKQNYPNPFNPQTTIEYQLPLSGRVTLRIYNVLGQEVKILGDENHSAGSYSVVWDGKDSFGKDVAAGIYFLQMRTKDFVQTKKLLLIK